MRASLVGPWVLCGDFNLIYQAQDKIMTAYLGG
jgi:hypothetical protein